MGWVVELMVEEQEQQEQAQPQPRYSGKARWYIVHAYSNFEQKVAEAMGRSVKVTSAE